MFHANVVPIMTNIPFLIGPTLYFYKNILFWIRPLNSVFSTVYFLRTVSHLCIAKSSSDFLCVAVDLIHVHKYEKEHYRQKSERGFSLDDG